MASLCRLEAVLVIAVSLSFVAVIQGKYDKPIRVADTCEENGGKIVLNRNALARVLLRPELEHKRLMIVSIVGAMRKGKSFIMGFLKRYLSEEGWKNPAWMGNAKRRNNDGFTWRKGIAKETTGIDIWGEPFTIRDGGEEEVFVLLMDTQGLFDTDTTLENNARLFAYSSLASSLQILNFQNVVEERDLQNLQFSAEFAGVAASAFEQIYELPEHFVLVQNWSEEEEYDFGEHGGKKYLNYLMAPRKGKEELNSVRETLEASFVKKRCYLIPNPGRNVTLRSFTGANEELGSEYLRYVKSFAETIFDKTKLPVRKWQEEPMTARMLYNFLVASDEALQNDGLPKVETLAEAYARSHYTNQYEKSFTTYEDEIKLSTTGEIVINDADLLKIHRIAQGNAVDLFESAKKLGSNAMKLEFSERLERKIAGSFQERKQDMELRKRVYLTKLEEHYFKKYSSAMSEVFQRNGVDLSEIDAAHEVNFQAVMKSFRGESSVCDSLAEEGASRVETEISTHYGRERDLFVTRKNAEDTKTLLEHEKSNVKEITQEMKQEKSRREVAERKVAQMESDRKQRGFSINIGPFGFEVHW